MSRIVIDDERCRGCMLCLAICPRGTIEAADHINRDGLQPVVQARPQECRGCAMCAMMCPHVAITEVYRDVRRREVREPYPVEGQ